MVGAQINSLNKSNHWLIDISILIFGLLAFYTLWLGNYPFFTPDEGRYSEIAREMVANSDYITPRLNGVVFLDKPALYYWLQAIAIHLFGVKEWALRLFPVLTAVLSCVYTYICGRHLFNRRTGLLSAIILATTSLYFGSSHYANMDLEVAVWISCSLLSFITAIKNHSNLRHYFLFAAYFFAALAFLTKGLIAIVFPLMMIGIWIMVTSQWRILTSVHLFKGILLFLLMITPWYWLAEKATPGFLHFFFITQQLSRFLSTTEFNNPTPFWFYAPIILIGFFPWTYFLFQSLTHSIKNVCSRRHEYSIESFLLIWVMIVCVFFSIPRSKTITYILPIFPALALILGHYLASKWEAIHQPGIFWGMLSQIILNMGLAITLFIVTYFHLFQFPTALTPYFTAFIILLISSSIFSYLLLQLKQKSLSPFFIYVSLTSVIFLLLLTLSIKHFNQNTTKPFIADLQFILEPQDEIVTYFKFHQDVPLYLGRRVTIVANWDSPNIPYNDNWVRELWYGMPYQDTSQWLINEDTFVKRWESDKRLFVFLNANYLDQFKRQIKNYFFVGQHNDIFLFCNKPNFLSYAKEV